MTNWHQKWTVYPSFRCQKKKVKNKTLKKRRVTKRNQELIKEEKRKNPFQLKTRPWPIFFCVQYFSRVCLGGWVTNHTCRRSETKKKSRRNSNVNRWLMDAFYHLSSWIYKIEVKWWNISLGGKHESNGINLEFKTQSRS